jgi:uncharacterized protein
MKSPVLIVLLAVILMPFCSKTVSAQSKIEDDYQMKQYFMVFLTAGQNRTQDSATAAIIQKGHLDNITRLFNEKKLVLAGPFLDDGVYRGIFILDVATVEEAIELLKTDPAIKSGRLDYEIHPWYGPGNIIVKSTPYQAK